MLVVIWNALLLPRRLCYFDFLIPPYGMDPPSHISSNRLFSYLSTQMGWLSFDQMAHPAVSERDNNAWLFTKFPKVP